MAWHLEDHPNDDEAEGYLAQARDVALTLGTQALAVLDDGQPVGYAQYERAGRTAEITDVYVLPDHRGRGLGTALTAAAIHATHDAADLWIEADDEDRPKRLYQRLGFHPVCKVTEFTRWPPKIAPTS